MVKIMKLGYQKYLSIYPIAIYNSKAFKRERTACTVHRVDSAHVRIQSNVSFLEHDVPYHRVGTMTYSRIRVLFYYLSYIMI